MGVYAGEIRTNRMLRDTHDLVEKLPPPNSKSHH